MQEKTAERISLKLFSLLKIPHNINSVNQSFLLIEGIEDTSIEKIQRFFIDELNIHPAASIIALGLSNGEYREAQRLEDGTIRVGEKGKKTKGSLELWSIDKTYLKYKKMQVVEHYDPTKRPWYLSSIKKGGPAWSEVYLYSSNQLPAISGNQPLLDKEGNIKGVLVTTISLKALSTFITETNMSPNSRILIMEPSGLLIAASGNIPLLTVSGERIDGEHTSDLFINEAVKEFKNTGSNVFSIKAGGNIFKVKTVSFSGPFELLWDILIITPETDFTKNLDKFAYRDIIFFSSILFFAFFSAYSISKKIAKPITLLAKQISTITYNSAMLNSSKVPPSIKYTSTEIETLSNNFETMMQRVSSAFRELEKSQTEYKNLVENINSIVMKITPDGTITYCNPYGLQFYGYKKQELIGNTVQNTVLNIKESRNQRILEEILDQDSEYWNSENKNVTRDGREVWILWSNRLILDEKGNTIELLSIGQDITTRKETENKLETSLKEKKILLSEIHHRVKNNLQIVISLVNLQLNDISDNTITKALQVIKTRIQSMALVHEMLYSTTSFSAIDLKTYIQTLANDIIQTFNTEGKNIDLVITADSISLDIEQAITVGLLLNEIISNAVKYAFKGRTSGKIEILILKQADNQIMIKVSDNGIGLSYSNTQGTGLGTILIDALADQLGTTVEKHEENGTSFRFVFRINGNNV